MPSFKDIAQRASVSVATVSHVVNGTRFVSKEVRDRVEAAMEALNYQPNLVARSLRRKQTKTVGLVVPDIGNQVFSSLAKTVESTFAQLDYHVIVSNTSYAVDQEIEQLKTLLSKRVDGIIIASASPEMTHLVDFHQKNNLPIVVVVSKVDGNEIDNVHSDDKKAGHAAADHLIELGHREIAYVDRLIDHTYSAARRQGFLATLRKQDIEVREDLIVRSDSFGFEGGYIAVRKIMGSNEHPTGIVCYNDTMAIGALAACNEYGWSVPQDVSIVGIDNHAKSHRQQKRLLWPW